MSPWQAALLAQLEKLTAAVARGEGALGHLDQLDELEGLTAALEAVEDAVGRIEQRLIAVEAAVVKRGSL